MPDIQIGFVAQALRFIEDAIEGTGDDEGYLLANDPDNVWCRIFSARQSLQIALGPISNTPQDQAVPHEREGR